MLIIPSNAARNTSALLNAEEVGIGIAKSLNINKFDMRMFSIHNLLVIASLLKAIETKEDKSKAINFLEIGTYNGVNARMITEIDSCINVFTYDIPINDPRTEACSSGETLKDHYRNRLKNTLHPRIQYLEKSSSWINFDQKSTLGIPNVILVDGDHSYPQAAFDILNAINFLTRNEDCIIIIDDILIDNAIFKSTELLAKDLELNVVYFEKRLGSNPMKYVATVSKSIPSFLIPIDI